MTIKALYPTVRPTLNLDFAKTKVLDPRITFTRASTATFVGSNGLIQTAASGAARFDHNPTTGESLGLLVEEARTNVCTYSAIDGNWSTTDGATITANAAVAPDGTLTAALVTFPGANIPRINRSLTVGAGTVTQTVWIKAVTGTVTIRVGNPSDYGANQTIGTTWTRVQASYASGSNEFGIYCSNPVSAASFHAWGAQMELGAFPTSYIPTVASTVTRAADVASMTGTNFSSWYNQNQGTVVGNFITTNAINNTPLAAFYNAANLSNYRISFRPGNTFATNVSSQFEFTTSYSSNILNKFAWGFGPTATASKNGSIFGTDNSVSLPLNLDAAIIGQVEDTGLWLNGTIARLAYYPVRLSDAQLQALTR